MQTSHAPYAGMRLGKVNRAMAGGQGEAMIAEQAIAAKAVLKAWSADHRDDLRKYQQSIVKLRRVQDDINEWIEEKGALSLSQREEIEKNANKYTDHANRLMKGLVESYRQAMMKAGVTTSTNYNFYDLRGPAYLIYPVNTPFWNSMPRWGKVNAGYGTMVHWKYTSIGPSAGSGSLNYAGAAEGKRVGVSLPNENDGVSQYSEFGVERAVSFTAEFAGEGYTDNVADEHIRGIHQLALQMEGIIIGGNQGASTNQNGFALGTANTPSTSVAASIPTGAPSDGSTTGFSNSTTVSVYVVELTALGYPSNGQYGYQAAPTVGATGLVPSYSRQDAGPYTGDTDTVNGGMGHVSASSNVSTALTSTPYIKASVVPKKGAIAWAWYVNDQDGNTPTTANSLLAAITTVPYCYFGSASTHTALSGNQAASATGLNADKSAQALDTSGMLAWAAAAGTWINMSDISKTDPSTNSTYNGLLQPVEAGTSKTPNIAQLDYDLRAQWTALQQVGNELWCSADVKASLNTALGAGGFAAGLRFQYERDAQGNVLGGFVVSGYKSIYSMKSTGAEEIPIRIHPMMPAGSYLIRQNGIPASYAHSRIPGVGGLFVQRDVYGIEWPINKRQWEWGTYMHCTYGDYMPAFLTFRTGIQGVSTT
jgi:hypothetical protein